MLLLYNYNAISPLERNVASTIFNNLAPLSLGTNYLHYKE